VSTALATVQSDAMQPFFSPEQERIILSSFLGGASKQEAAVLMEVARVRRLNPLLRQIHFVKRYDTMKREEVWSYQTSIDGLRTIAERTGRYQGQTKAEWCGKDGAWRDVWLSDEHPVAARVGVFKQGFVEPCYGVAKWSAFVQTKRDGSVTHFWARMGDLMLAKCAEALAIRRAFPEDTSGLYTDAEMGTEAEVEALPSHVREVKAEVLAPSALDPGIDPPAMSKPAPVPVEVMPDVTKQIMARAKALVAKGFCTNKTFLGAATRVLKRPITGLSQLSLDEMTRIERAMTPVDEVPDDELGRRPVEVEDYQGQEEES
jgi:phage recombination protein Bet